MDILARARKLESKIARRLDAAAEDVLGSGDREPIEIVHAIVESVERQIQAGGRGRRVFPFNRVAVAVLASSREARARFEAVFAAEPSVRERIVDRLQSAGCDTADLTVDVTCVPRASRGWDTPQFHIAFDRVPPPEVPEPVLETKSTRVELIVVRGTAEKRTYSFGAQRIDLGRCAEVRDQRNRLIRTNHVAFVEGDDVNKSVSRRHAHISCESGGDYRLHDDRSLHGTGIVRDGRTIPVPAGTRGVGLRTGDEVVIGEARVRVRLHSAADKTGG